MGDVGTVELPLDTAVADALVAELGPVTAGCVDPDRLLPLARAAVARVAAETGAESPVLVEVACTLVLIHVTHRWPYVDTDGWYAATGGL